DSDADDDGIEDRTESIDDPDGDGLGNWRDLDSDGDGIADRVEGIQDPDGDGLPAFVDLDADGDTIADEVEGTDDIDQDGRGAWVDLDADGDTIADSDERLVDPDGDGRPAYLDLDTDGDGINDAIEAGDTELSTPPVDHDGDGAPSFIDLDSDNDTIDDRTEGAVDQDGDQRLSFLDDDSDGDGIADATEAGDADVSTPPVDTDGDGFFDYVDFDSDADAISDRDEGLTDGDDDGLPDFRDRDADNDGRPDAAEAGDAALQTPPIDTDGDGLADFRDIDADGDGFGDAVETGCPLSTNHLSADSDGDRLADPVEVALGTDPCDEASSASGLFFVLDPMATSSATITFDRTEIDRADLALNVDTTGSMGGEIATLRSSLTSLIIPSLQAVVSEAGFAVSSFEDYPLTPFGANDVQDRPFRLLSRVTTDVSAAQNAVDRLAIRNGSDLPEAGLESLYQVATGVGTSWGTLPAQRVPPFDNAVGLLPGVADGPIGGVGFREGALPIIVHVTDATSHFAPTYRGVSPMIEAAPTATVRAALADIGARVISIASEPLPRPIATSQTDRWFAESCRRQTGRFFGRIDSPRATDIDWFELVGAPAGALVSVEVIARRIGSTLDSVVAIYDANGDRIALNDDLQTGVNSDSGLSTILTGTAPFYVAVSSYNDLDFDGVGALTSGYYFLDVVVSGNAFTPDTPTCPGIDLGSTRAQATPLGPVGAAPVGPPECEATCSAEIADEPFALPYGITQSTGASIPPCAWDEFGTRPAACALDECCTGANGLGQPPNAAGTCPLSFEVGSDGAGLGDAIVTGLEALVRFSAFEITTVVRPDPDALARLGIDTRCFVRRVVPTTAEPPNMCAPTPTANQDAWRDVVPGTTLTFRVDARNQIDDSARACAEAGSMPRAFRAFIDVVADGVTVIDTRTVTIVVPADPQVNNR
ncbi:MAG: hypothetical protein AAF449_05220, partial [Myxococcota bacterium]